MLPPDRWTNPLKLQYEAHSSLLAWLLWLLLANVAGTIPLNVFGPQKTLLGTDPAQWLRAQLLVAASWLMEKMRRCSKCFEQSCPLAILLFSELD